MNTRVGNVASLVMCLSALVSQGYALPPLGLTQISPSPIPLSNLELIDQVAYSGVPGGIWTVDSTGAKTFLPISHPTLGLPYSVTRAVKAFDGDLYAAANFGSASIYTGASLYSLDQLSTPIVTWESSQVVGVDINLRGFGNQEDATRFLLNGSTELLDYPAGAEPDYTGTGAAAATPTGYVIGNAAIPMTIGAAPALWAPTGDFSFVDGIGFATSIRDRNDGNGVNYGWNTGEPVVRLGEGGIFFISDQDGGPIDLAESVLVAHSDFAVFDGNPFTSTAEYLAFYPGLIPGFPDRSRPLLDIFPDLATIDIDIITDLASVNGYLYMTISGEDGLFLFGARDPSVIPEPATFALAFVGAVATLFIRRNKS